MPVFGEVDGCGRSVPEILPSKRWVLCVDERARFQALDPRQPDLPLKKGRRGTITHDYKRNGTTTLLAALEVLQGRDDLYMRHPDEVDRICRLHTGLKRSTIAISSSSTAFPKKTAAGVPCRVTI